MNQLKNYLPEVKSIARTASPNGRDYKHKGNFTPLTSWNGTEFNFKPIRKPKETKNEKRESD